MAIGAVNRIVGRDERAEDDGGSGAEAEGRKGGLVWKKGYIQEASSVISEVVTVKSIMNVTRQSRKKERLRHRPPLERPRARVPGWRTGMYGRSRPECCSDHCRKRKKHNRIG